MDNESNRPGLGKVVYSVDGNDVEREDEEERAAREDVEEADEESFPASDPPGFAGTSRAGSE